MRTATCHPDQPHLAKGLCGVCYRATYAGAYRLAHKDKTAEYDRARDWRAYYLAHKGRLVEYKRAWAAAHKDERAEQNSAWRRANPEKVSAIDKLRRARTLGAVGSCTWAQWKAIQVAYAGLCAYCGKKPAALSQDHVIPLSRGGSHTPENIVPACRSCNSRKGARPPTRLPTKRLLL